MKIINIKALNGPNYWAANIHKLIVMKLDLEGFEHRPTNKIDGFYQRLRMLLPSMQKHRCSKKVEGGFFLRVQEGTWMGHVVEHIALELQTLAGMYCGFGKTRKTRTKEGEYNVVFRCVHESCGRYAAQAAVEIALALINDKPYDIETDILKLKQLASKEAPGPSTSSIIEAAEKRKIPVIKLHNGSAYQLGYGASQKNIKATISGDTNYLAVSTAGNKGLTKKILSEAAIPVPNGVAVRAEDELPDVIHKLGFPLVVKPLDGNHGRGITVNIQTIDEAKEAFHTARKHSSAVLVERFLKGNDYRFLVIGHRLEAVALRIPARVFGDGRSTIKELIDRENLDEQRGEGHEKVLTKINIDVHTDKVLQDRGYDLETVLAHGEELRLKHTANISTGGTSKDVTDEVHPANRFLAERISRILGLDICGIDIISEDIGTSLYEQGGVLEVNAAPGFRMHLAPAEGKARDVGKAVVDMLFPDKNNGRIPIVAVTGTNGKTTTARLVAHMASGAGRFTGLTTTDGIYLGGHRIKEGDCAGPQSAELVLRDPQVELAVLETARGGILRSGMAFHDHDVGIITNISEDHMGIMDIHSIEQMTRVKSIVALSVKKDGYAVLNADNDHTYGLMGKLACKVALFSLSHENPRIIDHVKKGGLAAAVRHEDLMIFHGDSSFVVEKINNIPLTINGTAKFNIENVLAAVLGAYGVAIDLASIRAGLISFLPSPTLTPGRMNMFRFKDFDLMLDYVHNTDGIKRIREFMELQPAHPKIGVISAAGDRRDRDIYEIGCSAGAIFDEVIIRIDKYTRGRKAEEIIALLEAGIKSVNDRISYKVIKKEKDAIAYVVANAPKGALVFLFCEDVFLTIQTVEQHWEQDKKQRRSVASSGTKIKQKQRKVQGQ